MVSFRSVLIAALAATSVSAHPGHYRRAGHQHIARFSNTTIPAVETTTTSDLAAVPLSTGLPETVTTTETATTNVFTTVTVSYTLGNGKVVTKTFSKVRPAETSTSTTEVIPEPSTTSVIQATITVIPVATPEELTSYSSIIAAAPTPVPSAEEDPEDVTTTSTSTTTVFTTVTTRKEPAAQPTDAFDGLNNEFITKHPLGSIPHTDLANAAPECATAVTVTEFLPAATVTQRVPVSVLTVTSVSIQVSYITVAPTPTATAPVEFVEVPQPTSASDLDLGSDAEPTPEPTPVEEEVPAPVIPTVLPPFANSTAPFGNDTIRVTATVIPVMGTGVPLP